MKKISILALLLAVCFSTVLLAQNEEPPAANAQKVVDAGNKYCPVSGDPVSGKDFVENEGVRYGLCCPMCAAKFKKDPAKYIAAMKAKEMSGTGEQAGGTSSSHTM